MASSSSSSKPVAEFKLDSSSVGNTAGYYSSVESAVSVLTTKFVKHKRLQILVLCVNNLTDKIGMCRFDELSPDATEFAVFGFKGLSQFWGFVTYESLGVLNTISGDSFMIPRTFCHKNEPFYLTNGGIPHGDFAPPSDIFNNYKHSLNRDAEISFQDVQESVANRFLMYHQTTNQVPHEAMCLPTERDVILDDFTYFLVLAAITSPDFIRYSSAITRDKVRDVWLACEDRISTYRLRLTPLSQLQLPAYCKEVNFDTPELTEWRPFDKQYVRMPFEHIPSKLIANRKVVVRDGMAYIPRSLLYTICDTQVKAIHRVNFDESGVSVSKGQHKNIDAFMSVIRAKFASLCFSGESTQALQTAGSVRVTERDVALNHPPCMRELHTKATDIRYEPHLEYEDRRIFSRYLLALNFSNKAIHKMWKPKLDVAYRLKRGGEDVIPSLGSWHRTYRRRLSMRQPVGVSCMSMCMENKCPMRQLDLNTTKIHCAKTNGLAVVHNPQQFTMAAIVLKSRT